MHIKYVQYIYPPWGPRILMHVVKGDWNGAVSRNIKKGWSFVGAWSGMLKNPREYQWRREPDRRSKSACTSMCRHVYN